MYHSARAAPLSAPSVTVLTGLDGGVKLRKARLVPFQKRYCR